MASVRLIVIAVLFAALSACQHTADTPISVPARKAEVKEEDTKVVSTPPKAEKQEKQKERPIASPRTKKKKDTPQVLGWVERVALAGSEHVVKAKLDSGAKTSSIDAEVIKTFERDGKPYILYRVLLDDNLAETYESRIQRWVRIKDKKGGFIRRPVVRMRFCVGKRKLNGEVTLAKREHFIYPVLIGRNMLNGNILVDTSRTLLSKPKCK